MGISGEFKIQGEVFYSGNAFLPPNRPPIDKDIMAWTQIIKFVVCNVKGDIYGKLPLL